MMASYINVVESQGYQHFGGKLPTIFQIQDFIEHAWDLGINAQCRLETGGIRGTRKYIGTPEVSLNIKKGWHVILITYRRRRCLSVWAYREIFMLRGLAMFINITR